MDAKQKQMQEMDNEREKMLMEKVARERQREDRERRTEEAQADKLLVLALP